MADDYSVRDNIENDINDAKEAARTIAKPIEDIIRDKIEDEIGNQVAKQIAENAARQAAQAAAQTAGTAGTAGAAGVAGGAAATGTATATGGTVAAGGGAAAGGAVAEGATAGSAGGPAGIVVGVIIGAVVALGSAIKNETDIALDKDDPGGEKINAFFLMALIIIIFFTTVCGTLLSKGIASTLSVGQETEFQNSTVDGRNMALAGYQYKEGTALKDFNSEKPLKNAIWNYTYGTDGSGKTDGLRQTLSKALKKHCQNVIQQLESYTGSINGHHYDSDRSLDSFYKNRFPYDLAESFDEPPLIGDVLIPGQFFYNTTYSVWNPRYDDVNYAEIFAVFSMTDTVANGASYGFDWGDVNYKDFMEYLQKEECYKYMYELGLKWVPVYRGEKVVFNENDPNNDEDDTYDTETIEDEPFEYDDPDACRNAPETIDREGITCYWEEYYVKATVKPFGLRELFAMAFNTSDPVSASNMMHVNFYQHKNLYMLGYIERVTRLYEREDEVAYALDSGEIVSVADALGPGYDDYRSCMSSVYEDVNNSQWLIEKGWEGKGRSPWYYIENTFNDYFEHIEWESDPDEAEPPGEDYEPPEDGKILDMYKYLNQGWYKEVYRGSSGKTVARSGCLDCSIAMILMYYLRHNIDIADVSKYVNGEGNLEVTTVLSKYGLRQGGNNYSNVINGIINEIDAERPTIVHIRGYWATEDGTKVLHSSGNGHFLVAVGYDEYGIYVHDPGKQSNHRISYEDWAHVNDLYYRPVYQN